MSFVATVLLIALLLPRSASAQTVSFNFRAVNLAPNLTGLDVHFNNLAQASLTGLEFGYASQVLTNLPAQNGTYNVKVAETGQGVGASFAGKDVAAQGNREYVGVAYGPAGGRKLTVLERNRAQLPAAEKTLVRVLNALDEQIQIDVHLGSVGGTPLFSGILPDQAGPFLNIPAEATTLIITEAGKSVPIVQLTAPLGGTPYVTLIVTGQNRSDVQVYAMSDFESQKTQLVLLEEASYANVRVVHLRPNAGSLRGDSLDIYFNKATQSDTKVTDSLKYRFASREYGPIFADSFRVKFVPAGESPSTNVLALDRRMGNDTSYVVILTEFQDLKPTSLVLARTPVDPLPGLSSKIRVANASAFYGPVTLVLKYGSDTMRFEEVSFKSYTEFRDIPPGVILSVEAYRSGQTQPFFTGTPHIVPAGSYLTLIAFGNEQDFLVDALNESQSGRQLLTAYGPEGSSVPFGEERVVAGLSGAPNPAHGYTRLSFSLERAGRVGVDLYDATGRLAASVPAEHFEAGEREIDLNLSAVVPGVYTCVLRSGNASGVATRIVVTR